ncbi:hypothetical protein, partial [Shigella sonnei]|uniref:hypothetical protein n=1 Tax=Shigella sonnei TaxID=624 RepID=UPI0023EC218D
KNIIRWLLKKRTNGSVRYCQYTSVIVPVRDKTYYPILREAGVWAVQGEFRPMRFEQCEKLIG